MTGAAMNVNVKRVSTVTESLKTTATVRRRPATLDDRVTVANTPSPLHTAPQHTHRPDSVTGAAGMYLSEFHWGIRVSTGD